MAEITPKIIKRLGTLSHNEKTGWAKELNVVKWGDSSPKYDLRNWNADHTKCSKGITLGKAELTILRALLAPMDL